MVPLADLHFNAGLESLRQQHLQQFELGAQQQQQQQFENDRLHWRMLACGSNWSRAFFLEQQP